METNISKQWAISWFNKKELNFAQHQMYLQKINLVASPSYSIMLIAEECFLICLEIFSMLLRDLLTLACLSLAMFRENRLLGQRDLTS